MAAGKKLSPPRPPRKGKPRSSGKVPSPSGSPGLAEGTPQPYILQHYDKWAEKRFGRLTPYLFRFYNWWIEKLSKKQHRDCDIAKQIGSGMRFFLNSAVFWIIVYSLAMVITVRPVTFESLLLAGLPILISVPFFLVFLLMLKRVEVFAAKRRNIDLVSRSIWELNKSTLIRCTVGKIPTFIKEYKTPR
jgi:hypothetical protein